MADTKLTSLPLAVAVAVGDVLYLVTDPTGAPLSVKATVGQLLSLITAGNAAHAATHRVGGADPLVKAAWLDRINTFEQKVMINSANDPSLYLIDPLQTANTRVWRIMNNLQKLVFYTENDDGSGLVGRMYLERSGLLDVPGAIRTQGNGGLGSTVSGINLTAGYASPVAGRILFGDGSGWQLHLGPRVGGVNLDRFTFSDAGNLDIVGKLTTAGVQSSRRINVYGGATDYLTQIEVSGNSSAGIVLTNPNNPANAKKARILHLSTNIRFDFVNDAEDTVVSTSAVTIDKAGNVVTGGQLQGSSVTAGYLNSTGTINADGTVQSKGLNVTASTSILQAGGWTSLHFVDNSQPSGSRRFGMVNLGQNFYLGATDDTGSPVYGDWARSINITRDGGVGIGNGGLYVQRIINGAGLASGTYVPGGSGVALVSGISFYSMMWTRIGSVVTITGKFDVTVSAPGWASLVMTVPVGAVSAARGVVNFIGGGIGQIDNHTNPAYVQFTWYTTTVGAQAPYFTLMYTVV